MGTNRRKAVKEKLERVAKDRRIKARRERKQAKKVADRLLGKKLIGVSNSSGRWQYDYQYRNSKTGITTTLNF